MPSGLCVKACVCARACTCAGVTTFGKSWTDAQSWPSCFPRGGSSTCSFVAVCGGRCSYIWPGSLSGSVSFLSRITGHIELGFQPCSVFRFAFVMDGKKWPVCLFLQKIIHIYIHIYISQMAQGERICLSGPIGDTGSVPESGRSPGGGNGNPPQYSCLGNPMNRGAWWAAVHGVAESDTTE